MILLKKHNNSMRIVLKNNKYNVIIKNILTFLTTHSILLITVRRRTIIHLLERRIHDEKV